MSNENHDHDAIENLTAMRLPDLQCPCGKGA